MDTRNPIAAESGIRRPRAGRAGSIVLFVALLATGLALGGALAHLYELPAKMRLSEADYFTVQQIYAGWANLAWVLLVELIGMLALIVIYRREKAPLRGAVAALVFLAAAQILFWGFTFPTNGATNNWTIQPDNWERLRAQWEYSHAVGAVFQLLAFCALITVALARKDYAR